MLISDIIGNNCDFHGDCDALVGPGIRTETWVSVDRRTNQLGHALTRLGMIHGDRLTMLAPNCVEYNEFFMTCAKTGIIGAAANTRMSRAELVSYLNYVEPSAILVHVDFADLAREWLPDVPSIDTVIGFGGEHRFPLDLETMLAAEKTTPVASRVAEDDIYQLCPTSGTTGVMKAAVVTQRNATTAMAAWLADFDVREHETHLQTISLFFNAGGPAAGMHAVMMRGGRTVVPPRFEPELFLRTVQEYRANHTTVVPTMIRMLIAHPAFRSYDLTSMRVLTIGGAPVSRSTMEAVDGILGTAYPSYAMAESFSVGLVLPPHHRPTVASANGLLPAGQPQSFISSRVVRADGSDVARDGQDIGEIWLRGDSVVSGYFRRPDESARSREGDWFKTGDLAVWDTDGLITIVDRAKDMIITGGLKVVSLEVEQALLTHPGIAECAVIGLPHDTWGEAVHAEIVAVDGTTLSTDDVLNYARSMLAAHKCPLSVQFRSELPRTPTGKVLKQQLRQEKVPARADAPVGQA